MLTIAQIKLHNFKRFRDLTLNVNPEGFTDWSGQTLVNLLNLKETITVGNDGQATLSAPNRGYSIWVLKMEI